jgi:hypothetical protein
MSDQSTPAQPVYKEIPGWPGYRVGDDGSVWSRKRRHFEAWGDWRPLKLRVGTRGYYTVVLYRPGCPGGKRRYIHRLVLEAFVGPRPAGMNCCHFDGNRLNNRLENLRWDSVKSNHADTLRHGRSKRWGRHHFARLTVGQVVEIKRLLRQGLTHRAIAEQFPVTTGAIEHIARGSTWDYVPWPEERD